VGKLRHIIHFFLSGIPVQAAFFGRMELLPIEFVILAFGSLLSIKAQDQIFK
jgi:hypothetical protein